MHGSTSPNNGEDLSHTCKTVLVLKPSITEAGNMKFSAFCIIYLVDFIPAPSENVSRLQLFTEQSYHERAETEIYFEDHLGM